MINNQTAQGRWRRFRIQSTNSQQFWSFISCCTCQSHTASSGLIQHIMDSCLVYHTASPDLIHHVLISYCMPWSHTACLDRILHALISHCFVQYEWSSSSLNLFFISLTWNANIWRRMSENKITSSKLGYHYVPWLWYNDWLTCPRNTILTRRTNTYTHIILPIHSQTNKHMEVCIYTNIHTYTHTHTHTHRYTTKPKHL